MDTSSKRVSLFGGGSAFVSGWRKAIGALTHSKKDQEPWDMEEIDALVSKALNSMPMASSIAHPPDVMESIELDQGATQLMRIYRNRPISEILVPKPISCVSSNDSLGKALALMAKMNVLSCPVVNSDKKIVAVVDVLAIVKQLCRMLLEVEKSVETAGEAMEEFAEAVRKNLYDSKHVSVATAVKNDDSIVVPLYDNDSMHRLITALSIGAHRVLVLDHTNSSPTVLSVISQSDLIKLFAFDGSFLAGLELNQVSDLLTLRAPETIFSVSESVITMDAFTHLIEHNVSALAVVSADDDTKFVGCLSANAIKGLQSKDISLFFKPVGEFLSSLDNQTMVTCTKNTPVFECVTKINSEHAHRVWVVEEDHSTAQVSQACTRLEALLSLSDILRAVITNHEKL